MIKEILFAGFGLVAGSQFLGEMSPFDKSLADTGIVFTQSVQPTPTPQSKPEDVFQGNLNEDIVSIPSIEQEDTSPEALLKQRALDAIDTQCRGSKQECSKQLKKYIIAILDQHKGN